jgi:hypothetical protein
MPQKLAVIIVVLGAAFAVLLVNRQQRIDVAAEIARAQLRMDLHRKTISRLQASVAKAVHPDELRVAQAVVAAEWEPIPYRFDPFESSRSGTRLATAESKAGAAPRQPPSQTGDSGANQAKKAERTKNASRKPGDNAAPRGDRPVAQRRSVAAAPDQKSDQR